MKQTYRLAIWEEQSGYVNIKADSRKEAQRIAEEKLSDNGVDAFKDFDCTHRNVEVLD